MALSVASDAAAQSEPPPADAPPPPPPAGAPQPEPMPTLPPGAVPPVPKGPSRAVFEIDPVTDGSILAIGGGFAIVSSMLVATGEIAPQQISPTFNTSRLLSIDRVAISQTIDPNASTASNVGLYATLGYAFLDPVMSGFREHSFTTGLVDATLYGESIAMAAGVTNLAKLAVRRPRPIAYKEAASHKNDKTPYSNADTDSALSFFSGHASTIGAVGATATYLSFARSPHSFRPWLTLGVSLAMATFVDIERVRAGAHFPTDVLIGTFAGAGIGTLVVHFHRQGEKAKAYWIGWQNPQYGDGGALTLSGVF